MGADAQRSAARKVGIQKVGSFFPGHEEDYGGGVRIEVKAGGQVKPALTAFRRMRDQSEAKRPIGDHRPFLAVASDDGLTIGMFVLDQAANIAAALAENLGLEEQ